MTGLTFFLPLLAAALLLAWLPTRWRRYALTAASLAFAATFGMAGLVVLAAMTLLLWTAVRAMLRAPRRQAVRIAWGGGALLLLPLVLFKNYLGAASLLPGPAAGFAPVGLSFFTFRALGLLLDAAQQRIAQPPRLLDTASFLFFFPQLLSGPIERAGRFLPQLDAGRAPEYRRIVDGLILIAVGVFMKAVVADRLALHVDAVFANPASANRADAIVAFYFSAIQIYCDFSGYTNIALGLCAVMGIDAAVNFRQPYMASSISDFWNRWHMSLSFWLRDFLFLPLAYAGDRRLAALLPARKARELAVYTICALVTMTLCGVWHGAAWTFLLWGLLFGVYLAFGRALKPLRARAWRSLGFAPEHPFRRAVAVLATFHLVAVSWVFFRASTIADIGTFFSKMGALAASASPSITPLTRADIMLSLLLCAGVLVVQYAQERLSLLGALASRAPVLRWVLYVLLVASIEMLAVSQGPVRFAYAAF